MKTTDYCGYKLSLDLKACGFDEPCIAQWACEPDGKPILLGSTAFVFSNAELKGRDVTAPLLYHAQKWLRSKGVEVYVPLATDNDGYEWSIYDRNVRDNIDSNRGDDYKTYECALSAGLSAALDIFSYVGAYPDPKNQEPFAYLCGWVAKCINEVKNNKK